MLSFNVFFDISLDEELKKKTVELLVIWDLVTKYLW